MQCRNCGYRLWNLPSRKCPECGIEFKPSEFKFTPNSIRFCCPHCEQPYYGTDPNGHLVPQAFACASCGQSIHMDDMILQPAENVEEERTVGLEMPWLRKDRLGFWRRWFRTVGWALVRPQQLMRLTPARDPENSAWIFALFTSLLILLVATLPISFAVFIGAVASGPAGWARGGGLCCGILVVGPILTAIGLLLWGAITHGLLRLSGPTEHALERTCQALCYSSGANIVTAIPCMGFYVGWIWWLVGAVLMVKEGQRVGGRAGRRPRGVDRHTRSLGALCTPHRQAEFEQIQLFEHQPFVRGGREGLDLLEVDLGVGPMQRVQRSRHRGKLPLPKQLFRKM
ncbi:MAG: YIP1 family protein, partial [Planctomycetes bacterium]|nr:YIP1 family protein [Planctomycetota bacterium]